jgi:cobalt-zinc-cadmium efflux system protein
MAGENVRYRGKDFISTTRRLKLGIALGFSLVAAEATIGIITRSLALISDAAHNAADTLAVGLSLFAVYMMARAPTERRTFGYGRVGILTALANSVGLVAIAGILAYEAIIRMIHIRPVSGATIFTVGIAAFVINGLVALTLFSHRHDLNIKSAFLHMVADAGVSIGVLVAGVVILFTKWYYADPVIALVISAFIVYAAWGIIRDATDILLESVPRQIDTVEVQDTMESIPGVKAVHHLHVWELGSGVYALSGHVEVADRALSECSMIMEEINERLEERFNIIHPTIQMECAARCPTQGEGPVER